MVFMSIGTEHMHVKLPTWLHMNPKLSSQHCNETSCAARNKHLREHRN
jgi:hypothetical protein